MRIPNWPNSDPLGEEGGINLYTFVVNEPTGILDAWGLAPMSCRDVGDLIKPNNKSQPKIDDAIIKCIAYRESGFEPTATNPNSSATGLMAMT